MKGFVLIVATAVCLAAASPEWTRAHSLYQRTEYRQSLAVLEAGPQKDAATLELTGQNFFMLGQYKKASDAFEKAIPLDPNNAKLMRWLGRAYGRRAETGNRLFAPGLASKTRQMFERAVKLDPADREAAGDLLDYYLDAPGFLGGGLPKAESLVQTILQSDPAEGHYAQGLVAEKKKDYDAAEREYRKALQLAQGDVSRVLLLARFLAKHDKVEESDALFEKAARMAPGNSKVMFDRAAAYMGEKRETDAARKLLERYVQAPLTPEDPPRERAQAMLKKLGA